MFTGLLSLLKGKLFSQAGSFLLPIFGLIAIFLIWNSDMILTKFGFETTTNLKAEVIRLQGEVDNLTEINKKQTEEILRIKASNEVTIAAVEGVAEVKAETKTKVSGIIEERRQKAKDLMAQYEKCACEETEEDVSVLEAPVDIKAKQMTSLMKDHNRPASNDKSFQVETPKVEKPKKKTINSEVVNQLSADNIDALNAAYAEFFPETAK